MDLKNGQLSTENEAARKLAAKKLAITNAKPSGGNRRWLAVLAVILLATVAGGYSFISKEEPAVTASGQMFDFIPTTGVVSYQLSEFESGIPRFYQHKAGAGVIVRYFLVKTGENEYHAALDTCASCWQSGQGHRFEGDELVCPTCHKRFAITEMDSHSDACAPLALTSSVAGDSISVNIPELLAGAKYFKNSREER